MYAYDERHKIKSDLINKPDSRLTWAEFCRQGDTSDWYYIQFTTFSYYLSLFSLKYYIFDNTGTQTSYSVS